MNLKNVKKIRISLIVVIVVLMTTSLIYADSIFGKSEDAEVKLKKQVNELELKINTLNNKFERVFVKLDKINTRIDSVAQINRISNMQGITENSLGQIVSELESIVKVLSSDVLNLKSQFKLFKNRVGYADSVNYEILSQLMALESRILSLSDNLKVYGGQSLETDQIEPEKSATSYKEKYLQGLSYHQNGKHDEAIEIFKQLLERDINNEYSDNAQFWIGECYFSLKLYSAAIVEFKKVFNFPNSNKGDDAQYKLGVCYFALGDEGKARLAFQKLKENYPRSEFIVKINRLLK